MTDWMWVAFVVVGVAIGVGVGFRLALSRSASDQMAFRALTETQVALALQLQSSRLADERVREHCRRVEDSYVQLGRWIHALERTIDEIWGGVCSSSEEERVKTVLMLDEWPWETLRVPDYAVASSFHWSEGVNRAVRRFKAGSTEFVFAARSSLLDSSKQEAKDEAWQERNNLYGYLDAIRGTIRTDVEGMSGVSANKSPYE